MMGDGLIDLQKNLPSDLSPETVSIAAPMMCLKGDSCVYKV